MRKLLLVSFAAVSIFCACKDPFSLAPVIPQEDSGGARNIVNISATQGGKRSIELNWDAVSGAVRYNIARASSPLEPFVQCGETTDNWFKFDVSPGTTAYYRVNALLAGGKESGWSSYVMGSSLAQPFITDITDISESSATITWYMENVSGTTYKAGLRYIAYCFNQATGVEVAQIALDGSQLAENKARFTGLFAETKYSYQIEAFLVSDQSSSEKSDTVDRETAIRSKPGAPVKFKASQGAFKDAIELSFELPEPVKIKNGEYYEQHGLYFVISKRIYSESGKNAFTPVCFYLGDSAEMAPHAASKHDSAAFFDNYDIGKTVTWTDPTAVNREEKYEYQVQAYVNGTTKILSSDESNAAATGWALAMGKLSVEMPVYTQDEAELFNVGAELKLHFEFDPRGVEYGYKVVETVKPIGDDDPLDFYGDFTRESNAPLTYAQMRGYTAKMDLTRKTDAHSSGRGVYYYTVKISLPDETLLDEIAAFSEREVSENINPLVVEDFVVLDGFTNKFRITWKDYPNRRYVLFDKEEGKTWVERSIVSESTSNGNEPGVSRFVDIEGYTPGISRYFALQPVIVVDGNPVKTGPKFEYSVESMPQISQTLGVPKMAESGGSPSYGTVTAAWAGAQKADAYRIKYWYAEDGANTVATAGTVKASDLSPDVSGNFKFAFSPFTNSSVDVSKAGKEIQIKVEALNEGLRAAVGGGEIVTTSAESVSTRLVGPALIGLSTSKAASASEIDVSWNRISGADGYYVFRRQFNMANTSEEGAEAVVYYVPATQSSITVTGKNMALSAGTKVDTTVVKAGITLQDGRYTLHDMNMSDTEYSGAYASHTDTYKNQQNNLTWGYPYRYYVVPVINQGGAPEMLTAIDFAYGKDGSNNNTAISSYAIREGIVNIRYTGAASIEQEGFTFGFGQNVVASKGTYASSGNANNGIEITWESPPLLSAVTGFAPRYTLYRRATGGDWNVATSNMSERRYIDTTLDRGIAYEYAVGITNGGTGAGSQPQSFRRFIDLCYTMWDDRDRPKMLGFMLDMVKLDSVSRDERKSGNDFAEEIRWPSVGVKNSAKSGDLNWGLDGYTVFVMNRNIDGNWHEIADISNIPNQTNQSILVTNNTGLLKVLRDYKHYFKVRSYVLKDGEKIYCPDPPYNYEALYAADRSKLGQDTYRADQNKLQTEYVKWGARQVTPTEFVKIATLAMTWGIHKDTTGTAWTTRWSYIRWTSANGNNGSAGRIGVETSFGVGQWWFNIQNYRPDMDTNANRGNWEQSVTFVTIDTGDTDSRKIIYADSDGSGKYPNWYGVDRNYGTEFCDIKGPADTPNLYTGAMRFVNLRWTSGYIEVKYPAAAASVQVTDAQTNTPLPFQNHKGNPDYRYNQDAWY